MVENLQNLEFQWILVPWLPSNNIFDKFQQKLARLSAQRLQRLNYGHKVEWNIPLGKGFSCGLKSKILRWFIKIIFILLSKTWQFCIIGIIQQYNTSKFIWIDVLFRADISILCTLIWKNNITLNLFNKFTAKSNKG